MVATVRREFMVDVDLVEALEARSQATGVPVDQIVSDVLRNELRTVHDEPYFRDGVLLIRRPGTGNRVTAEEIYALMEEIE